VATLVDEMLPAGSHQVRWTGQRDDGARMSSGVYLYRMTTNGFVDVRKMLLVK
jgi:flagellar hook assembly protein FlgD